MRVGIVAGCAAVAALCAACGDGGTDVAGGAGCPSEAEAHAALETYITTDYWDPGERDIWNVTEVDGFQFGAMQVGAITDKQVEYGQMAQPVCPVRIAYSFTAHKEDGSSEVTEMGVNQTHLFYKDPFGDWTFRTES